MPDMLINAYHPEVLVETKPTSRGTKKDSYKHKKAKESGFFCFVIGFILQFWIIVFAQLYCPNQLDWKAACGFPVVGFILSCVLPSTPAPFWFTGCGWCATPALIQQPSWALYV